VIQSITKADLGICENADSFLQSSMWGRFKARFGWEANSFSVDWDPGGVKPLLALSRRIAPGISMAYVPWGPELPAVINSDPQLRAGALTELAPALRSLMPHVAFIRFDPPLYGEWGMPTLFKRAASDIQPPDTVLVDLKPPLQDILAAMKPKWRYNIGLAEKRNVIVNTSTVNINTKAVNTNTDTVNDDEGINVFYRLLSETAERDGISIHSAKYYRALFEECQRTQITVPPTSPLYTPAPHLYTAVHEGDTLAAIVVLFRGNVATYLYGASANIKRNLMAPYALQWKAMQDARASGCTVYDLFGIPPDDNPNHPMAGLYRFKTGFGGKIVHRPGSWDYPCKPLLYALFSAAERLRKKVRDGRKRRGG
jgi:lipid II:glycine glycyltransferase (peptidoglycan interpeptide bridge formation enzyme)